MYITTGTRLTLPTELWQALLLYRYRVFVEKLGWHLDCAVGEELDQFDRDDTVYVIARQGPHIVGVARLLPTHKPYLLKEVFPQVLGGQALPHSAHIWEISRFAAVDLQQQTFTGHSLSSPNAVALLHEVLKVAACHKVRQLITVSPPGITRLLRNAGFDAHCEGKLTVIDGHKIMANWISVPPCLADQEVA